MYPVHALGGPTASGKSEVALAVADRLDVEIVSCDAMQVYRGMDIGTAKPSAADQDRVRHHCLDLVEPWEEFSAADYQRAARAAIADICARGSTPLLVGGTGLYLRAAVDDVTLSAPPDPSRRGMLEATPLPELVARLEDLDASRASRVDLRNPRRVIRAIEIVEDEGTGSEPDTAWTQRCSIYDLTLMVIEPPTRSELWTRIDTRVDAMLEAGWLDETRRLSELGRPVSRTAAAAIGYAQLRSVLAGERPLDDAVATIKTRTRSFARRQLTWFRGDERCRWMSKPPADAVDDVIAAIERRRA